MQGDGFIAPILDLEPLLHGRWRWTWGRLVRDVDDAPVIANDCEILQDGGQPVLGVGTSQGVLNALRRAGS